MIRANEIAALVSVGMILVFTVVCMIMFEGSN